MKPANHYASTTPIPDWFEYTISHLPNHDILNFIGDLTRAIRENKFESSRAVAILTDRVDTWLESQDRDTFKTLLQWVAMELI